MSDDHLFVRNMDDGRYELLCLVCRISLVPHLPMSVTEFVKAMKTFEREHKNCQREPDSNDHAV